MKFDETPPIKWSNEQLKSTNEDKLNLCVQK